MWTGHFCYSECTCFALNLLGLFFEFMEALTINLAEFCQPSCHKVIPKRPADATLNCKATVSLAVRKKSLIVNCWAGEEGFPSKFGIWPFYHPWHYKMCSELIHWKLSGLSASTFQHWLLLFHWPAHLVHNFIYHRVLSFSFTVGVLPLATSQISCIQ